MVRCVSALVIAWFTASLNLFGASASIDPQRRTELQAQLISAFNRQGCEGISRFLTVKNLSEFTPISLAVLGFCQTEFSKATELFLRAEEEDPTHDEVARLHATYVWRKNPIMAIPLWEKVLLLARDQPLRVLARSYLDGHPPDEQKIEIDKPWAYYGTVQVGTGYAANPGLTADSLGGGKGSLVGNSIVSAGLQREFGGYFVGTNYGLTYNKYFENSPADLLVQDLDIPLSVRIGSNEDLRLRPFLSNWVLGGKMYYSYLGVGVLGVVFRNSYKQRLQASVYRDFFQSPLLHPQEGYHYRCEYSWELFPAPWYIKVFVSVEHVSAGRDRNTPTNLLVLYSHNDMGIDGFFEYSLQWIIFGLNGHFLLREDSQDSRYKDAVGTLVTKNREDFQMIFEPTVSVPLTPEMQLIALYRYSQRLSNWTRGDYQDKTFSNHEFNFSLKVSLKSL